MPGIRTRSSSVPTPAARRVSSGGIVTRGVGKSRNIPQDPGQRNPRIRANIVAENNPDAPGAEIDPANVQPEDIVEEMGQADPNLNDPPEIPPINPAVENSIALAGLPASIDLDNTVPLAKGSNLRMYSDEDIKAIILATRMDFIEQSSCSMSNINMGSTGSTASSEIMQDLCDTQSIIDIDLMDAIENTMTETRRVSVKEYTVTTTHQSAMAGKLNFTNDGNNNRTKLKELELLLNDCELYNLAEGKRTPMKSSESNPDGYTHE